MKCDNCNKRLPLIFNRKSRINTKLFDKELGEIECEFCSDECALKFANKLNAKILY